MEEVKNPPTPMQSVRYYRLLQRQLSKGAFDICIVSSAQITGTIVLKLVTYKPDETKEEISFINSTISYNSSDEYFDIFKNNIFLIGVVNALGIRITFTIFIYYKNIGVELYNALNNYNEPKYKYVGKNIQNKTCFLNHKTNKETFKNLYRTLMNYLIKIICESISLVSDSQNVTTSHKLDNMVFSLDSQKTRLFSSLPCYPIKFEKRGIEIILNLINKDLLIENTKSTSDIEKQRIPGLEVELQNISDEYEDELTRNDISLMNREKLKNKEYYGKLCKYIKKNC
ncbi:hypothetical protein MKS88_005230 [Plasmodium brasilianum]|uniref:Uncharacterized protein n=1 Tax=Plasmodium brasilianum TaxID=5824 RepID=A0ACB9Y2P8_PLABR|nr:hypothetical protein MKS88_005230 [Plasmodium brasilianum]